MTIYKYFGILCKEQESKFNFWNRNSKDEWLKCFGTSNLNWCIMHNFVKYSKPMIYLGEKKSEEYYEYTKLGRFLKYYYTLSTWKFIKYIFSRDFLNLIKS